ncbi:hypothetical protein VTL71DRAFT_11841 [Oculimacula yallundae]|uniref:CBM1 domain-containing protein n=1 Tax=Oculimacula yallundae TaxID=86028 RepID=A0ABR4CR71_9HELO
MKIPFLGSLFLGLASLVVAAPKNILEERQASVGDGPFAPADYQVIPSLPRHTIYRPNNAAGAGAMPIFVWANGACTLDSLSARTFLAQIASYGYLVIAQGTPNGKGSSNVALMREAVTWAAGGAGGLWNVDRSKIMVAGFSCGGAETWGFINDDRVKSIGIFSSGGTSLANTIRKPILFALGGPSDVAYNNGESDYRNLPSGTPSWKGNLNRVGHGGFLYERNGGLFGKMTVKWLALVLRGDTSARSYFEGNTAVADGWTNAVSKSLNLIPTGNGPTTTAGSGPVTTTRAQTTPTAASGSCSPQFGQCGGNGWTGPKCCSAGTCKATNEWYSQCL